MELGKLMIFSFKYLAFVSNIEPVGTLHNSQQSSFGAAQDEKYIPGFRKS